MDRFRHAIEDCNFFDLGYSESRFTWTNCREAGHFMKERLDRTLANSDWCDLFLDVAVTVLAARTSDHKPLLVSLSSNSSWRRRKRLFRFEACWNLDAEYVEVVKEAWSSGSERG